MTSFTTTDSPKALQTGVLLGIAAYFWWGFFPAYFKLLDHLSAVTILCHRIIWSFVFLVMLIVLTRRHAEVLSIFRQRKVVLTLCISTLLITGNWLTFLFAVNAGHVLQSSLGYFMTPLLSILLGFLFLGERLNRWQNVSLLLTIAGVLWLTIAQGELPWISLLLAFTFGTYGLLRKQVNVDSLIGLTVETMLLTPIALGTLFYLDIEGTPFFGELSVDPLFLLLSGVVTAVPLLLFAASARRLRLATVGFLQYITPTLHFLLAIFAFREPFSTVHAVSFALIWAALLIYTVASLRRTPSYSSAA
jgi:chloramphenicol-sensitive protein RarD